MKLGKLCCLKCQVPYYPEKPYGTWAPRPQPRIKSLMPAHQHQVSIADAAVRAHQDKYEKNFDAVVTFLSQYINKGAPTPNAQDASVGQSRPAKWQRPALPMALSREKIQLKKYSSVEYESMSTEQQQQLYELQKKARLIEGKKTLEGSRALEAKVDTLKPKTDNSSNDSLFADETPKADNRSNKAVDRRGNRTRQSNVDT